MDIYRNEIVNLDHHFMTNPHPVSNEHTKDYFSKNVEPI